MGDSSENISAWVSNSWVGLVDRAFWAFSDRQVTSQPKVTSQTITGDSRKESRQLDPVPQHAISC
jgi:hypothetical protein